VGIVVPGFDPTAGIMLMGHRSDVWEIRVWLYKNTRPNKSVMHRYISNLKDVCVFV